MKILKKINEMAARYKELIERSAFLKKEIEFNIGIEKKIKEEFGLGVANIENPTLKELYNEIYIVQREISKIEREVFEIKKLLEEIDLSGSLIEEELVENSDENSKEEPVKNLKEDFEIVGNKFTGVKENSNPVEVSVKDVLEKILLLKASSVFEREQLLFSLSCKEFNEMVKLIGKVEISEPAFKAMFRNVKQTLITLNVIEYHLKTIEISICKNEFKEFSEAEIKSLKTLLKGLKESYGVQSSFVAPNTAWITINGEQFKFRYNAVDTDYGLKKARKTYNERVAEIEARISAINKAEGMDLSKPTEDFFENYEILVSRYVAELRYLILIDAYIRAKKGYNPNGQDYTGLKLLA